MFLTWKYIIYRFVVDEQIFTQKSLSAIITFDFLVCVNYLKITPVY